MSGIAQFFINIKITPENLKGLHNLQIRTKSIVLLNDANTGFYFTGLGFNIQAVVVTVNRKQN
jgi:hypothetical protein